MRYQGWPSVTGPEITSGAQYELSSRPPNGPSVKWFCTRSRPAEPTDQRRADGVRGFPKAGGLKLVIRDPLDLFRLRRAVLSLAGAAGRESARPNRQGKWGSASGAVLGDLCQVWIRSGLLGSKTPGLDLYRGI